jgi:hypothetical protein
VVVGEHEVALVSDEVGVVGCGSAEGGHLSMVAMVKESIDLEAASS